MKTCTVILSGGLDSTTVLYLLKKKKVDLLAVSFNYGQKHRKELIFAEKTCLELNIPHIIIPMDFLGQYLDSSLTQNIEIPEGHYKAKSMKSTVVPNRNAIMALIAHSIGYSKGYKNIALGIHSGDHFIYPDCRPKFIKNLQTLLRSSCDNNKIDIITPFLKFNKAAIIAQGLKLGVKYEHTWTCYKGQEMACGKCGSCMERKEAFKKNNTIDPLEYEA